LLPPERSVKGFRSWARQPWTQWLPWAALALFIFVALINIAGFFAPWWFLLPVGLAMVSLVFGIVARRRVDIVLSALIVLALPLWLLGIIVLLALSPNPFFENNAFSP
jgi:hypothetical protein